MAMAMMKGIYAKIAPVFDTVHMTTLTQSTLVAEETVLMAKMMIVDS
jgi:hypothetical protein